MYKIISQKQFDRMVEQHNLWWDSKGQEGSRLILNNYDLTSIKLTDLNLKSAILQHCMLIYQDFYNSQLQYVDFSYSLLNHSRFHDLDLTGVNFSYSNLSYSNLTGAHIDNTNFTKTYLHGINVNYVSNYSSRNPLLVREDVKNNIERLFPDHIGYAVLNQDQLMYNTNIAENTMIGNISIFKNYVGGVSSSGMEFDVNAINHTRYFTIYTYDDVLSIYNNYDVVWKIQFYDYCIPFNSENMVVCDRILLLQIMGTVLQLREEGGINESE